MDREDSAAGIVHNRLECHAKVTFKSEIDRYKSMRKLLEAGGVGKFSGIERGSRKKGDGAANTGHGYLKVTSSSPEFCRALALQEARKDPVAETRVSSRQTVTGW